MASLPSLPCSHILKMKRLLKEDVSKITIYPNSPLRGQTYYPISGINEKRIT